MPPPPKYFASAPIFRAWLRKHHARAPELWVGFHKKASGTPSMSWEESVDLALCFGWIDGVRKRVDDQRYVIRFTRRQPRSIWSRRNIGRLRHLAKQGLVEPVGLAAFGRMTSARRAVYSYEQRQHARLEPAQQELFRASGPAWAYFRAQAPSYRRIASWWVISAKREETRVRRLGKLIGASAAGRRIDAGPPPQKSV